MPDDLDVNKKYIKLINSYPTLLLRESTSPETKYSLNITNRF